MRTRYLREYSTKKKGVKNGTARWKNSVSCKTMNSMWMPAVGGHCQESIIWKKTISAMALNMMTMGDLSRILTRTQHM